MVITAPIETMPSNDYRVNEKRWRRKHLFRERRLRPTVRLAPPPSAHPSRPGDYGMVAGCAAFRPPRRGSVAMIGHTDRQGPFSQDQPNVNDSCTNTGRLHTTYSYDKGNTSSPAS